MTDTPVTVTLTEREWEELIYEGQTQIPERYIRAIEDAIADQVQSCD